MPNHNVINRIRDSIADINDGLIHRKIVSPEKLYSLSDFIGKGESKYHYLNVPIKSIVALDREGDTWLEGDSWKDVVMKRLHGDDWPEEVFDYLENDIGDKPFPTSNTRLELICYGGLITCSNGNHRLPAGICWLTYKNIEYLKYVRTNMVQLDAEALETLKSFCTRTNQSLDICLGLNPWGKQFFDSDKLIKTNGKYYSFNKSSVEQIHSDVVPIFNMIKRVLMDDDFAEKTRALESQNWVRISPKLLQLLFEQSTWFRSTIQNQSTQ